MAPPSASRARLTWSRRSHTRSIPTTCSCKAENRRSDGEDRHQGAAAHSLVLEEDVSSQGGGDGTRSVDVSPITRATGFDRFDLERFVSAQDATYARVLTELTRGLKTSHWMWFIFPQLAGLGFSDTARTYSIRNIEEAELYLQDDVLSGRLVEIAEALLDVNDKSASEIFGSPDDMKLHSSMTLFSIVKNSNQVFQGVLDKYFSGKPDEKTLSLLKRNFND